MRAGNQADEHVFQIGLGPFPMQPFGGAPSPEVLVGKFLAMAPDGDSRGFDAIQRKDNTLDYWDGEP